MQITRKFWFHFPFEFRILLLFKTICSLLEVLMWWLGYGTLEASHPLIVIYFVYLMCTLPFIMCRIVKWWGAWRQGYVSLLTFSFLFHKLYGQKGVWLKTQVNPHTSLIWIIYSVHVSNILKNIYLFCFETVIEYMGTTVFENSTYHTNYHQSIKQVWYNSKANKLCVCVFVLDIFTTG